MLQWRDRAGGRQTACNAMRCRPAAASTMRRTRQHRACAGAYQRFRAAAVSSLGKKRANLGRAAQATGADTSGWPRVKRGRVPCNQHIARILTRASHQQVQPGRLDRWQVLQAMHCDINPLLGQGAFNLYHKHPVPANFCQRHVRHCIAGCANLFNGYLQVRPTLLELLDYPARLNHRQLAAPSADYETFHALLFPNQTNSVKPQHRHAPDHRPRHL